MQAGTGADKCKHGGRYCGPGLSVAGQWTEPHLNGSHRHKEEMMTEEKKKPEEGEVTDEQLEDVSGGSDLSAASTAKQVEQMTSEVIEGAEASGELKDANKQAMRVIAETQAAKDQMVHRGII